MFLVVGGFDDEYVRNRASTELLTSKNQYAAWVLANNLPRKMSGMRCVTIGGVLHMTGISTV